jgi:hypothetical protein
MKPFPVAPPLPECGAKDCARVADPRWYAHGHDGKSQMICDGHPGTPCEAGGIVGFSGTIELDPPRGTCTCPPMKEG